MQYTCCLLPPAALQATLAACSAEGADDKELEALGDVLCALCCHEQLRGRLCEAGACGLLLNW
jgi:hypothetical protein